MIQVYDGNLNLQIEFQPHGWNLINQFKQLSNGYVVAGSADNVVSVIPLAKVLKKSRGMSS